MPDSTEIPLHLYQVLEEEYISLHGQIPAQEVLSVKLPDEVTSVWREIKATRDWRFGEGHLKDPVGFADDLLSALKPATDATPAYALKQYLLTRINHQVLENLSSSGKVGIHHGDIPRELVKPLEEALNELLLDKDLYQAERFSDHWLSDDSQGLVSLYSSPETFKGDDLAQFNRLLLEDAFPKALEKVHNIRLAAMYQRFHKQQQKGLCLSGGGIRSGTFALGILQGMARHDLLKEFDYLSTVSGGGYIGSWLTAWIHRHPDGLEGVTRELANNTPTSKVDPEPEPVRYLRTYSNFITPKAGLLTADTWTFVGIYLRNLFLNWLVIIPLLVAVLLLPRLMLTMTLMQPDNSQPLVHNFLGWDFHWRHIFLSLGYALGVWALTYIIFNRPGLREKLEMRSRFWRSRTEQRSFLWWCLIPLIGAAICLTTYWAWSREQGQDDRSLTIFLIFGLSFTLIAWLIASLVVRRRWTETAVGELAGLVFAGLIGGFLFWALEQPRGNTPVVGYDKPFDWTTTNWLVWKTEWFVCFGVPVFLLIFLLAVTFFVGLSSASHRIDDEDREWWSRFSAWCLIVIIAWSIFHLLVIFGPVALLEFPTLFASLGGATGLVTLLIGYSAKTPANEKEEAQGGIISKLTSRILPLLALVFLALFLAAVSLATTGVIKGLAGFANTKWFNEHIGRKADLFDVEWLTNVTDDPNVAPHGFDKYIQYISPQVVGAKSTTLAQLVHMNVLHHTSIWFILALIALMAGVGLALGKIINLNIFSLHGGYRNRLIRGFLGASRPDGQRKPNPFTGFDPADNIHMHELRPALLDDSDFLKPEILATALRAALSGEKTDALSMYLAQKNLLKNSKSHLEIYKPGDPVPAGLMAALRTDLNSVLEEESLYAENISQLATKRGRRIHQIIETLPGHDVPSKDSLRSDYHILLNRLVLEQTYTEAIKPIESPPPPYKLLHVINTTLNLVGGDNLAWQQRKAEPFSITPLHSGCFRLGYRRSRDYGGREGGGISIGTAAAISGAAASSNMGYYTSSPVLSLLLTLFNVRLGWWLGNPGHAGNQTYQLRAPDNAVTPVIHEALGLTDDRNEYVYLTDGGHFENLALYEMVLRRCQVIVVSDGAEDEKYRFSDLGNAVRKIRIDFGVPIVFTNVPIYSALPPKEKGRGMYWAIGKIRYSCIDPDAPDGVLLYLKPAVYGNEPRDILEYKKTFPAFPHQSTGDQFFDEPQFESYRMLGSHVMDQLCGEGTDQLDMYQVINNAFVQLTEVKDEHIAADPQLSDWLSKWLDKRILSSPPRSTERY